MLPPYSTRLPPMGQNCKELSSIKFHLSKKIQPSTAMSSKRQSHDMQDTMEHPDSNKRPRVATDPSSPLCTACQTLNVDAGFKDAFSAYQLKSRLESAQQGICKAFDGTYFYNDAIFVHRFGVRLAHPSQCPLCTFFRELRVQPDKHERFKLLAFRSSDSWLFRADRLRDVLKEGGLPGHRDRVFMVVVPDLEGIPPGGYEPRWLDHDIPSTGAIYRHSVEDEFRGDDEMDLLDVRELGEKADVEKMREWLDCCRNSHGDSCKRQASNEPIVRGFRLIDCFKDNDTPVVEEKAWGTEYVALSYVWGSTPEDLQDWPKTVLDAIETTKRLGFQYLWVDRCCINQSDMDEKSYLISRMTTIYEAAAFTIVAAAGSGASHGLPGIGNTPRLPQPKYYLDSGSKLLSMMRDPRRDILESPYWTRGWTYQEGVLSNRHIVFTDSQIYWECRCMAIHESTVMPIVHMPQTDEENSDWVMADFMLTGIFKSDAYSGGSSHDQDDLVIYQDETYRLDHGFPVNEQVTVRTQMRGLNEHIREFSKRQLSRDTDTLPAFQGIIGLYEQAKEIYLLHGLPMWIGNIYGAASGAQLTFALTVSSWYHRAGPDHFMFVSEACPRKNHLPSWTWAGWSGVVTWRAPPSLEHCAYMSDLIKSTTRSLVWAADIYLSSPAHPSPNRLLGSGTALSDRLTREVPTLLEIKNPFVLNSFARVLDIEKQWSWVKYVGRPGREQRSSQQCDWDAKWYRIGRRLSCIGMSVAMTGKEWTDKHRSGELVSVLVFAGKYHENEHGTARFLTVRRVASSPERWERIGTLYLIIPFLGKCHDTSGLFRKIPASRQNRAIVIQ
ncbi:HET-domain-containing protein [Lentithecium fluviatile CBS 122367]|uniref:HET-domain-containing protein n=1 Tax=Lentithecium fluviatile CBS 122367 TaxID=1168545 RepID=A0A6G1IPJ4_9PLEO|nr:HET-domain-containing protein [Lentithecium fluviatile CBS 122367]